MSRAKYQIVEETADLLLIHDIGENCKSVTNDIEAVVEELEPRRNGRRLEYYDSMGNRDKIIVKDGKFSGFDPAGMAGILRRNL